jgi:hypothetical protein
LALQIKVRAIYPSVLFLASEESSFITDLERRPRDVSAQRIYNFSVARVVEDVERANLQPWREASNIACGRERFRLAAPRPVDAEHKGRYDLLPIDTLKASGQFFKTRFSVGGIGAPLVAVGRSENRQFRLAVQTPPNLRTGHRHH